jgi:hypothetical protein
LSGKQFNIGLVQVHGVARGVRRRATELRSPAILPGGRESQPIRDFKLRADARSIQRIRKVYRIAEIVVVSNFEPRPKLKHQLESSIGLLSENIVQFSAGILCASSKQSCGKNGGRNRRAKSHFLDAIAGTLVISDYGLLASKPKVFLCDLCAKFPPKIGSVSQYQRTTRAHHGKV